MNPISRKNIRRSLSKKGFKAEGDIWYFWFNGRRTSIRVKISSGKQYRAYRNGALKTKIGLLGLQSLRELKDLFICPMDMNKYIDILISRRIKI